MNKQVGMKPLLQQMDAYEFEHLIADLWAAQGWETRVLQASNDRGIDVEARRAEPFKQKHLIQAKRYSAGNKIGSEMVQQYASLRHQEENVDAVLIITTSNFTKQAREIAANLNVKLINGDELVRLIERQDATDVVNQYVSGRDRDTNAQEINQDTTIWSSQTLDSAEVRDIYVSKLSDNAIGETVTKSRLTRSTAGVFISRTETKNPVLNYLYRNEQPHFVLLCAKIRLPNQELLNPPNNGYFVATDNRIFVIIGEKEEDGEIELDYRDITDVRFIMDFGIRHKIGIKTSESQFRFAIDEEKQEMENCVQYIKNVVYQLI